MAQYATVCTSDDDGVTWTRRDLNPAPDSAGLAYPLAAGGRRWVTSGYDFTTMNFYAGAPARNWLKGSGPGGGNYLSMIAYGGGQFVGELFTVLAPDDNTFATSPDGSEWTSVTSPWDFNQNQAWGLAYSPDLGLWVALGITRGSSFPVDSQEVTSPDGVTWTDQGSTLSDADLFVGNGFYLSRGSLMWVGRLGLFVFVCSVQPWNTDVPLTNAATSPDGVTWTATGHVYSTRYGDWGGSDGADTNGGWVGIDDDGTTTICVVQSKGEFDESFLIFASLFASTDGATWTELPYDTFPDYFSPVGIAYGDGTWVTVGQSTPFEGALTPAYAFSSTDGGVTWTERTLPDDFEFPVDVKYQDGVFVVLGQTPTPPPSAPQGWNVGRIALP